MKWFSKIKPGPDLQVSVAYEYHKESSRSVIIYNLGKRSLRGLTIVVENESGERYSYQIPELQVKIGIKLNLIEKADLNHEFFQGKVSKLTISVAAQQFHFMPLEGKPFRQL